MVFRTKQFFKEPAEMFMVPSNHAGLLSNETDFAIPG